MERTHDLSKVFATCCYLKDKKGSLTALTATKIVLRFSDDDNLIKRLSFK
jgi:hypothetical protein